MIHNAISMHTIIYPHHTPPAWEVVDLAVPVHEVHEAIMVVVVMSTLGGVHRQLEVVGAQPVTLCVSIAEYTRLQQLVVTVGDTCGNSSK